MEKKNFQKSSSTILDVWTIELLNTSKHKVIPVKGRGSPQGCETSRLPHFLHDRLTDDGEVSLTRRPPFIPQEDSWYFR
jgi:hypothetical protein